MKRIQYFISKRTLMRFFAIISDYNVSRPAIETGFISSDSIARVRRGDNSINSMSPIAERPRAAPANCILIGGQKRSALTIWCVFVL